MSEELRRIAELERQREQINAEITLRKQRHRCQAVIAMPEVARAQIVPYKTTDTDPTALGISQASLYPAPINLSQSAAVAAVKVAYDELTRQMEEKA